MNRNQAIQWCKENKCNFINPVFPPPEDWMWCENGGDGIVLQCVHTVIEENPLISVSDVR